MQVAQTEGIRKQLRLALNGHKNIGKVHSDLGVQLEGAYTRIAGPSIAEEIFYAFANITSQLLASISIPA